MKPLNVGDIVEANRCAAPGIYKSGDLFEVVAYRKPTLDDIEKGWLRLNPYGFNRDPVLIIPMPILDWMCKKWPDEYFIVRAYGGDNFQEVKETQEKPQEIIEI